jgi:hypothetical protein
VRYGYRLGLRGRDAEEWYGEVWVDVPTVVALGVRASSPSAGDAIRVSFTLPGGGTAFLELFDARGRRLLTRTVEAPSAGAQVLDLAPKEPLRAGVHLVRLVHGDRSATTKAIVMR